MLVVMCDPAAHLPLPNPEGWSRHHCSTQSSAKQTTEFSMKPKSQLLHTLHCRLRLSLLQRAAPRGCHLGSELRRMLHTRYVVQCAANTTVSPCSVECALCSVDLCAGSINQSIAHLAGRYYLLIFIEFSLLFPNAQLCTRHCLT